MNEYFNASGVAAVDTRLLFYGVLMTIALTWAAWSIYGHLQLWREEEIDFMKTSVRVITSLLMVTVLGFYL